MSSSTAATPPEHAEADAKVNIDLDEKTPPKLQHHLSIRAPGLKSRVQVTDHGVDISIVEESGHVLDLLDPAFEEARLRPDEDLPSATLAMIPPYLSKIPTDSSPPLNIVIQIVGSRGDVQPFVSLGKVLREVYHHRVRVATHLVFREFVEENGLEFFNIGGDPAELMAFMVHNPGLVPDVETLRSGEIGKRRKGTYEMLIGCWRSCIESGDGTGPPVFEFKSKDFLPTGAKPFIADAIIANPPSFAHIHCAEKLGVPLHLMFTMPWSPTQSFPHPLVNIKSSNTTGDRTNFMSYALVEMITWQGLGDVINSFRHKVLNLAPLNLMWAPGLASRLRVPFTYCWSPALIPKPKDWGNHISISGFFFLSASSSFTPDPALLEFLAAGLPPVYIGFGSIVVDDPDAMTDMIFKAVKKTGVRALVSKGWGGLGGNDLKKPDEVFMLGNVPHDWLFQHVSAVVHHGGAGTTAAGVLAGRPTVVVPFFGDQPFWGKMINRAGAGPYPIPYKNLTVDVLVDQLKFALKPETLTKAQDLGNQMRKEDGAAVGANLFHKHLGQEIRCSLTPERAAVWKVKKTELRLSAKAATVLASRGVIDFKDLKLYRPREYQIEDGPWDPVSGVASALLGTLGSLMIGVADIPVEAFHHIKTKVDETRESRANVASLSHRDHSKITSASSLPITKVETNKYEHNHTDKESSSGSSTPRYEGESIYSQSSATASSKSLSIVSGSPTEPTGPVSDDDKTLAEPASNPQTPRHSIDSASITSAPTVSSPLKDEHPLTSSPSSSSSQISHITFDGPNGSSRQAERRAAHVAEAVLKIPMDLSASIAQGFHNAPRLYGDHTVREAGNITGFHSGMKAAGKDLALGFYDGISGMVSQPYNGAKESGVAGFLAGVVKGMGGVVLKPTAAITGVPASALRGVYKQLQRSTDFCLQTHITVSRAAQGVNESIDLTTAEEDAIVAAWHVAKKADEERTWCPIKEDLDFHHHGLKFKNTRHLTFHDVKCLLETRGLRKTSPGAVIALKEDFHARTQHAEVKEKEHEKADHDERKHEKDPHIDAVHHRIFSNLNIKIKAEVEKHKEHRERHHREHAEKKLAHAATFPKAEAPTANGLGTVIKENTAVVIKEDTAVIV